MKYPHTTCMACKMPMTRINEHITCKIRVRYYQCSVCERTVSRYYHLPTRHEYRTLVSALLSPIRLARGDLSPPERPVSGYGL